MTSALEALRRPLLVGAAAPLASGGPARAQKPAAPYLRSFDASADTFRVIWKNRLLGKPMITFVVDGTPKVASMNLENIGEFLRVPVKGDTTSGARE